jgi:hypothetical protein
MRFEPTISVQVQRRNRKRPDEAVVIENEVSRLARQMLDSKKSKRR